MGEQPSRVYSVGALGVENIKKIQLLSKDALEASINFELKDKNLLVTFHPETLSPLPPQEQMQELLDALQELSEFGIIFTKANADAGGKIINAMIDDFVTRNKQRSVAFDSLGQLRYFSTIAYVDAVVGNSSSGILEVPSFSKATINIGNRQKGRVQAASIINVELDTKSIKEAIEQIFTPKFDKILKNSKNPYESNDTSMRITQSLKNVSLNNLLIKKFHTLKDCDA